jgi:hypothetical protein
MISTGALTALVFIALGVTILTPVLLLVLVFLDWKRGQLW